MSEQKKDPSGWSSTLSVEGMDQAIQSLGYRSRRSPKYRLVDAVRAFCLEAGGPDALTVVPVDDLVRRLWDVEGDRSALVSRRRNLSSLRSSVNADLMERYRSGDNPEGMIIGPQYSFVICDEAKDQALQALRDMTPGNGDGELQRIGELLQQLQGRLGDSEEGAPSVSGERDETLDALRQAVQALAARWEGSPPAEEAAEEAGEPLDEEDLEEAYEDVDLVEEDEPDGEGEAEEAEEEAGEPLDEEDLEDAYEDVDLVEEDEPDGEGEAEGAEDEEDLEDAYEDVDPVEEDEPDMEGEGDPEKSRLLAEEFNRSLAAMDRFYNRYVLVPEGTYPFHASSPGGDEDAATALPAFYIGKFPVTNGLFELFVERTGYRTTAERLGWGTVYEGRYRRETDERSGSRTLHVGRGAVCSRVEGACWYQPAGPGSTLRGKRIHPVVQVSLEDAMAFAAWTGKRLPTEGEWEAAMRTLDGNLLPWGDVWVPEACNVEEACIGDTSPVDLFTAFENPWGVADGLGNVLEWTSSRAREKAGARRVARGGGWIARRGITLADVTELSPDARSNILGFRCVAY